MDILRDLVGQELVNIDINENVLGADEVWFDTEHGSEYCLRATRISFFGAPSDLIDSEIQIVRVYSDSVQFSSRHGIVTFYVQGHRAVEVL